MTRTVAFACAASLALGLTFIFIWAPHPWGWGGIDQYHDLALELARGRPFSTIEVPWGYAYFLAGFYAAFGDRPWIPLVAQAIVNASIPALVFTIARSWLDARTAACAALLAGLFSFNTVYASTQSSDAVCTFLFMAALAAFVAARRRRDWRWFALAGALAGATPQFRPNLLLVPILLAAFALADRSRPTIGHAAALVAAACAVLAPWTARNYRLTHSVVPTSVHAGVQLWYGTLQVGPYLNSRAYNPRSVFEAPAFQYSSLLDVPIVVTADVNPCLPARPRWTTLSYWTDWDATRRRVTQQTADRPFAADLPAPRRPTVLYYVVEADCDDRPLAAARDAGEASARTELVPSSGAAAPLLFFLSRDHLRDLDVHGDLLDIFDLVRLARRDAWHEPLAFGDRLEAAGVGDLAAAIEALTPIPAAGRGTEPPPRLRVAPDRAAIVLPDGSAIEVPRAWTGLITDLTIDRGLALALMHTSASLAELRVARAAGGRLAGHSRDERDEVGIDRVFYRHEPHMMRRYVALALDNIRRDPLEFAAASAYRAVRLFVIAGSSDRSTAQQFAGSRAVYTAGMLASAAYLTLFGAGILVAWRRRYAFWLPLLLILYVPATLAPVLTNMRYTVTVQPIVFMFVALALTSASDRQWRRRAGVPAAAGRAETRTAHLP
jgi:dolichyl-phosphate-mannose-protein mannosyltransferase